MLPAETRLAVYHQLRVVVEHILKFIEMVLKCEIDFKISVFYRFLTFSKLTNDEIF